MQASRGKLCLGLICVASLLPSDSNAAICLLPIEQSERAYLADDQVLLSTAKNLSLPTATGSVGEPLVDLDGERVTEFFKTSRGVFFTSERKKLDHTWEHQVYAPTGENQWTNVLKDTHITGYQNHYETSDNVFVVIGKNLDIANKSLNPEFEFRQVVGATTKSPELADVGAITSYTPIIAEPTTSDARRQIFFIINQKLLYQLTDRGLQLIEVWTIGSPIAAAATRHGVFFSGTGGVVRLDQNGHVEPAPGMPGMFVTDFYEIPPRLFVGTTRGLYEYSPEGAFNLVLDESFTVRSVHELAAGIYVLTDRGVFRQRAPQEFERVAENVVDGVFRKGFRTGEDDQTAEVFFTGDDPKYGDLDLKTYRLSAQGEVLEQRFSKDPDTKAIRLSTASFSDTALGVVLATQSGLYLNDGKDEWIEILGDDMEQFKDTPEVLALPNARHTGNNEAASRSVAFVNTWPGGVLRLVESPLAADKVELKREPPESLLFPGTQLSLAWRINDYPCAFVQGVVEQALKIYPNNPGKVPQVRTDKIAQYPFFASIDQDFTKIQGDYNIHLELQEPASKAPIVEPFPPFSTSYFKWFYDAYYWFGGLSRGIKISLLLVAPAVFFLILYIWGRCLYKNVRYRILRMRKDPRAFDQIFINYRRLDHGRALSLCQQLCDHFDEQLIFFDRGSIKGGELFPARLQKSVENCTAFLILIGPNWANIGDEHGRRLDQPEDYVRREIVLALQCKKMIVPLRFGGASVPNVEELPEVLKPLAECHMDEISDSLEEYKGQIERLATALAKHPNLPCPKRLRR